MGHKAVVLQPVGFLCDHVEILYDIDIDFKKQAAALGMTLYRADSLDDSPTLIRAIEQALQREPTPESPGEAPAKRPTRPSTTPEKEPVGA